MTIGRPKKENPMSYAIKVSVDEKTYKALGRESAEKGISIAEIFRRSYRESKQEADNDT